MNRSEDVNPRARYAGWVAPLCWIAVALEGFDLVVLGVVLPSLLKYDDWGLNPNSASVISVIGLVGVMIGALAAGTISDLIGRRKAMLWTVISFSVLTLLCAFAPNPMIFGLLRLLAGLGLGGVLPTALALINEYAGRGHGGRATTTVMTGYHVGAVLTALVGILVIESYGWRWMFVIGALPALALVPLMLKYLPESTAFLQSRAEGATPVVPKSGASTPRSSKNPLGMLFHHGLARSTVAFWATSFMGLLLVYGLNTWLPQIMREAGYELGAALALLLVLNVGAVAGAAGGGTGRGQDRHPALGHRLVRQCRAVPGEPASNCRASACTSVCCSPGCSCSARRSWSMRTSRTSIRPTLVARLWAQLPAWAGSEPSPGRC
jgi:AAHS family benzoate transporter-like MFS transporter